MIKIFFFAIVILFLAMFYDSYRENSALCIVSEKIIEIGGCDRIGTCSFITESGVVGQSFYPVKGQVVCTKKDY